MTNKISLILIMSLTVLTMLGLSIGAWNYIGEQKLSEEKTVEIDGETQTEIEVNLSDFYPGVSKSFKTNLNGNKSDRFDIEIKFEKTGADTLAKFINVTIAVNGETISTSELEELLKGNSLCFSADFQDKSLISLEITYSMSIDTGDEAQNTSAEFAILINSTR